jgi:hypothetical protein
MPAKRKASPNKTTPQTPPLDANLDYIRGTCRALETAFDREALLMLFSVGAFAVEDPGKIADAIERLRTHKSKIDAQLEKWYKRYDAATWPEGLKALHVEYSELCDDEQMDSVEAAYLLGIAVGRRIGTQPLKVGAR